MKLCFGTYAILLLSVAVFVLGGLAIDPASGGDTKAPSSPPTMSGYASWYSTAESHGIPASGEPLRDDALTCAAWGFPFGTRLRVEGEDGKVVVVRVTDRGPAGRLYAQGRIVDLTRAAFEKLAPLASGLARVRVTVMRGEACTQKP